MRRARAPLAVAAAMLALAGCGGDKPQIPSTNANALVRVLRTVQRQTAAHACTTVNQTIASLERRVELLPAKTDSDIRATLNDGVSNLRALVASSCTGIPRKPKKKQTTSSETSTSLPTTTAPPTTTETQTTNTNTQTTTTSTTPPSTQTTPPPPPPSGGTPPGQQKKGKGK